MSNSYTNYLGSKSCCNYNGAKSQGPPGAPGTRAPNCRWRWCWDKYLST